jgi:hypothetical protein
LLKGLLGRKLRTLGTMQPNVLDRILQKLNSFITGLQKSILLQRQGTKVSCIGKRRKQRFDILEVKKQLMEVVKRLQQLYFHNWMNEDARQFWEFHFSSMLFSNSGDVISALLSWRDECKDDEVRTQDKHIASPFMIEVHPRMLDLKWNEIQCVLEVQSLSTNYDTNSQVTPKNSRKLIPVFSKADASQSMVSCACLSHIGFEIDWEAFHQNNLANYLDRTESGTCIFFLTKDFVSSKDCDPLFPLVKSKGLPFIVVPNEDGELLLRNYPETMRDLLSGVVFKGPMQTCRNALYYVVQFCESHGHILKASDLEDINHWVSDFVSSEEFNFRDGSENTKLEYLKGIQYRISNSHMKMMRISLKNFALGFQVDERFAYTICHQILPNGTKLSLFVTKIENPTENRVEITLRADSRFLLPMLLLLSCRKVFQVVHNRDCWDVEIESIESIEEIL